MLKGECGESPREQTFTPHSHPLSPDIASRAEVVGIRVGVLGREMAPLHCTPQLIMLFVLPYAILLVTKGMKKWERNVNESVVKWEKLRTNWHQH
jgi:hypothetical protein